MNYYQHHIGDFIRDTSRLTDSQCMAYLRLIWMYYESEKPLPNNPRSLALRIGSTQDDVSLLLEAFFTLENDQWKHNRCESEIAGYKAICNRNKTNGGAGGRPKKTQWVSNGNPVETVSEPHRNPNQEPVSSNHKPVTKNQNINPQPPSPKSAQDDVFKSEFDEVWMLYPPRPGASKAKSLAAYIARRKAGSSAPEIRNGVIAYATYVAVCNTEPQFIKQPETFFGPGMHFLSDWTPPKPRAIANGPNPNARIDAGMEAVQRAKAMLFGCDDEN